jgi:hypothetical protein
MTKTMAMSLCAALLAAMPGARAEEAAAKAQQAERAPGHRLRVVFQQTRWRGEAKTAARSYALALHADGEPARIFLGIQAGISVSDRDAPAMTFKNAGVEARVRATTLADGRYRLDARFEDGSVLAPELETTDSAPGGANPILRIVRGESHLTLREGETVPFAAVVDPVSGELVRLDVQLSALSSTRATPPAADGSRMRAELAIVRRHGETQVARRPYAVVFQPGDDEKVQVFGGSMLPVQVKVSGQLTVAYKDVGAGLRLKAGRAADGRYPLSLEFSDGVLAPGPGAPQLRVFDGASQILLQDGETVTVASGVDPLTGDRVDAELTIETAGPQAEDRPGAGRP